MFLISQHTHKNTLQHDHSCHLSAPARTEVQGLGGCPRQWENGPQISLPFSLRELREPSKCYNRAAGACAGPGFVNTKGRHWFQEQSGSTAGQTSTLAREKQRKEKKEQIHPRIKNRYTLTTHQRWLLGAWNMTGTACKLLRKRTSIILWTVTLK